MKHKNFFIVPNQIFELGLKPKEFVVYCCLLRHSDKNTDNCFPSRRLIADECSTDKKTVDSALKELEARGLIKKVCRYRENGSRTSNMYYLASLLEQRRISLWVASDIRIHKKIKESKRITNRKEKDIERLSQQNAIIDTHNQRKSESQPTHIYSSFLPVQAPRTPYVAI